ncbi:MAG TPA: hypothetical protein VIY29_09465 [Ktedonobacteraceae bacterium]
MPAYRGELSPDRDRVGAEAMPKGSPLTRLATVTVCPGLCGRGKMLPSRPAW